MTYYKILLHGRSCHGGDCEYALPTQREDGTWEPGEWMPGIREPLAVCVNGYHLTREPARWWQEGAECYVAEWDGEFVSDDGDKIAVRRCRLLRRLTPVELATLKVFVEGSHRVNDGVAAVSGSAKVEAFGSAQVRAYGSGLVEAHGSVQVRAYDFAQVGAFDFSRVEAYDSVQAWAHDFARVEAYDSAQVWAHYSAQVLASGSAQIWAHDSSRVDASGSARVRAHGFSRVEASGSAQVWACDSALVRTLPRAWGQPTVIIYDAAVWVDYHRGVPVVHTAEGRREPAAPSAIREGR